MYLGIGDLDVPWPLRGVPWPSRGVPWPLYEDHSLEPAYYLYSDVTDDYIINVDLTRFLLVNFNAFIGIVKRDLLLQYHAVHRVRAVTVD